MSNEELDRLIASNPILARAASIICGAACGAYSTCSSREAAKALMDAGVLVALPKDMEALVTSIEVVRGRCDFAEGDRQDFRVADIRNILNAAAGVTKWPDSAEGRQP